MEKNSKILKQIKSEKIYAVVPKSLKEKVVRYKAKENMSESEIVNVALNEFFKVKMLKEDVDTITETMTKAIEKQLGKRFERMLILLGHVASPAVHVHLIVDLSRFCAVFYDTD